MLVVLRTNLTNRELTETKLDKLERLPIRLLGAVLSDTPASGAAYYHYQHHSYIPGYESHDEEDDAATAQWSVGGDTTLPSNGDGDDSTQAQQPASDGEMTNEDLRETLADRVEANFGGSTEQIESELGSFEGSAPREELHEHHQRSNQLRQ